MTRIQSDPRLPEAVDVAVVGSGPTGAAYARILAEAGPHLRVAIFEAGPTVSDPPGGHVKNIVDPEARAEAQRASQARRFVGEHAEATVDSPGAMQADRRQARPGTHLLPEGGDVPQAAMSTNVGGMGAHWTAACPHPRESERISCVDDLDELLEEARRLLGVTTDAFEDAPFTHVVRERLAAAVDGGRPADARVAPMPLAVRRTEDGALHWSGSDVVLGDVLRRSGQNGGVELHDRALVTSITQDAAGAATGLTVRDLSLEEAADGAAEGRADVAEHRVAARVVVVAADALRTPQLLWASGIRPPALGRWFNDQMQVVHAARLDRLPAATRRAGSDDGESALTRTSGVTWIPYTDDQPFHGQVMQLDASPVPLPDDARAAPGSIVGLGLFCARRPHPEDRIVFDDSPDGFGLPTMRLEHPLTAEDQSVVERARIEIVRLARALGEPLGEEPFLLPAGSSLHYQGTVRMGAADDGSSVCSPRSEVWGHQGLFVAGNGVIPTALACNPTLTSVALAVAGAREIARRLDRAVEAADRPTALAAGEE